MRRFPEHVPTPYLGAGRIRFAPPVPGPGVTPHEFLELRRSVASSPRAIMALAKLLRTTQ